MFSALLASFVAISLRLPADASATPGGVSKATFDKIKVGMTPQEIQTLIGRGKAPSIFKGYDYSEEELWTDDNDTKRIWVEYEPTVANGKTTRASFIDYSKTPFVEFKLRRVATKEECATAIDQLVADAKAKKTLEESDTFTKQIPVDGPKARRLISARPDYRSYHLLMALRTTNPSAYKTVPTAVRASVLCSTLKEQECFDDWMAPDSTFADPADLLEAEKALVECGKAAVPYLLPLLDDHTDARNSDPEEEPEYDYRRADYAFRYISLILKVPYSFQPEPADRDKDIATLKQKLAGGSSASTGRRPRESSESYSLLTSSMFALTCYLPGSETEAALPERWPSSARYSTGRRPAFGKWVFIPALTSTQKVAIFPCRPHGSNDQSEGEVGYLGREPDYPSPIAALETVITSERSQVL